VDHLDRFALLLAVGIIVFVLFVPPVVGLADNGDFCKICSRFDLYLPNHTGLDRTAYADTTYQFDPKHHWASDNITPEISIAWLAVRLNRIFNSTTFDMRWMGALHAALYLLVFYLALPLMRGLSKIRRAILMAAIILILFDIMYVSALSSFYMDTAAWIFLCLSVVFYLRTLRWPTNKHRIALLISFALLMTAKTQHIVAGLALLVLILVTRRQLGFTGRLWIGSLATAAFLSLTLAWMGTPRGYTSIPVFNTIFLELLPHSDNVHRDLAELGLDDSYARWIGMHTYMKGSPMSEDSFVQTFKQRTGQMRIAAFYARHPAKTWQMLMGATAEAGHQRPYLGNYDRKTGAHQNQESSSFSAWSSLKRALFWHHGEMYLVYVLGLIALLSILAWRRSGIRAAVVAFGVLTIVELLIASLGDVMDTLRHEWVFNALTDLGVVFVVALLVGGKARIQESENSRIQEEQLVTR
jgi:hypothetical protein